MADEITTHVADHVEARMEECVPAKPEWPRLVTDVVRDPEAVIAAFRPFLDNPDEPKE